MVKKLNKMSADKRTGPQLSGAVKESAQQIWLAGLGAFSKAQEEGGKVFETLVKEGLSIQRKTQAVAEEKISSATSKMTTMASDIQSRAGTQWDKLENIFEERVAKALNKLGVPSAKDVKALNARIDELSKSRPARAPSAKKTARPAAKTPAKTAAKTSRKPAAKRPAARKSA
jgi:poly(hydroxyalkanoate) granule-associated protein